MDYNIFQRIIDGTFKNQNTLKVSIKIRTSEFYTVKKSISEFHRTITNSKQIISNQSNRTFWKSHFDSGLYTYHISKEFIRIDYFLNTQSDISDSLIINLKTRIKKIIWCDVSVDVINSIKKNSTQFFNQNGIGIRFIGEGHKIQRHILTSNLIS